MLPYAFKDFRTSAALNDEQAGKITEIILIMQETGQTGQFDITELPE